MTEAWRRIKQLPTKARSRLMTLLIAACLGSAYLFGAFGPADRFLNDHNFLLSDRAASGDLVLVTIDPLSIQKLNTWPWSRAYHAALIDRLAAAGAEAIAFDIDFSAASTSEADARLARSIEAANGRVTLAAFMQFSRRGDQSSVTAQLPLPAFWHAAKIGYVNFIPDPDGRLRRYRQTEDRLPGRPVGLASMLAQEAGQAPNDFAIDYSIRPDTIPRISYVDALTGSFDPELMRGHKVLVGATALELGDYYAVPRHGFLFGVEIQALAFESLKQGRAIGRMRAAATLFGMLYVFGFCRWLMTGSWVRQFGFALLSTSLIFAVGFVVQETAALAIDIAPWLAATGASLLLALVGDARRLAREAIIHRDAARRHRALMQSVYSDSSDGILILDSQGAVEHANNEACRLLEREAAALIGRPVEELLPGAALTWPRTEVHASQTGVVPVGSRGLSLGPGSLRRRRTSGELTVNTPSGRQVVVAYTITLSRRQLESRGRAIHHLAPIEVYIVTFRDESARHAVALAREQVLAELQAATAAKSAFISRMSHELRTPLSAIIGFSGIIRDQAMGPVGNEKYVAYAGDIHDGGRRLLNLLNDVIDIARIEANEFKLEPDVFDLKALLAGCAEAALATGGSGERSAEIYVDPSIAVLQADPKVLKRAVANLLSNAVKFTMPGGNIVLRAGRREDGWVSVAVQDDGIGMDPSMLQSVTSAFSQGSTGLARSHEGAGLGLHIARRLIELQGGRLEIASEIQMGTLVTLLLPSDLVVTCYGEAPLGTIAAE